MSDAKITILTDLDPSGPRTHVRIEIPAPPHLDHDARHKIRDKIQQMVREEIARIVVRRTIGL